ncbi:hypothetical protein GOP47_0008063 [Adiantum capillus-veneris]|uniref:Uncharacterized protein n=1 Tax=Adiantum capillus-veneris TaxID=13818 RepID=A0A9D4ZHP9_ADICA|nr:hypothetical protein GOP47_0008063 [Adiantum capillus-veneris]
MIMRMEGLQDLDAPNCFWMHAELLLNGLSLNKVMNKHKWIVLVSVVAHWFSEDVVKRPVYSKVVVF